MKRNRLLHRILVFKVVTTVLLWAGPTLLFPPAAFQWLGAPAPVPLVFVRLLGMAYLALVVGYVAGLRQLRQGGDATATVTVGIVSNGGACVILLAFGLGGAWADWGPLAVGYMWASVILSGAIAGALATAGWGRKDGR